MHVLAWVFVQGQVAGGVCSEWTLRSMEEDHTNATEGVKGDLDCRGPLARSHPSNAEVDDHRLSHLPIAHYAPVLGQIMPMSVSSGFPSETGL